MAAVASTAGAASWPPVPPEVWSLKDDPADPVKGAVVLEERLSFHESYLEFLYRVRILSEAGRDAAEFPLFASAAYDVDGRTVFADGREVRFSDKKDLQTITVKTKGESEARSRLVPPGVTGDCVVELRWKESATDAPGPLPQHYGLFHQFVLGNKYRTLVSSVQLPYQFSWSYRFTGPPDMKVENKDRFGYTVRNIPPIEDVPFVLQPVRDLPRFIVYWQPEMLIAPAHEGEAAYWKNVGKLVYKDWYGKTSKGAEVDTFAREILKDLPEDPQVKALEIMTRLDARIANLSALTYAEKGKETEKDGKKDFESTDLGTTVRRGKTDSFGMFLLYLHLLKQAGVKPTVALVADRDRAFFRSGLLTPFQLDHHLVAITAPGRNPIFVDPSLRFASPGLVLPDYQGTHGLEIDLETWATRPISVSVQAPAFNVRQFSYEITAGEEEDVFKMTARFGGYPEYRERRRFMALEPKEQARLLREDLETDLKGAVLTRTEVLHAQDSKENVSWAAEGRLEVESSRRRSLSPFPAMPWAVPIPSGLPEKRSLPIVLPYSRVQSARSRVHMPAGFRLVPMTPFSQANNVGSVKYEAKEDTPGIVDVAMSVELKGVVLAPEGYGQVKDFLAWVEEATRRTILLERSR